MDGFDYGMVSITKKSIIMINSSACLNLKYFYTANGVLHTGVKGGKNTRFLHTVAKII